MRLWHNFYIQYLSFLPTSLSNTINFKRKVNWFYSSKIIKARYYQLTISRHILISHLFLNDSILQPLLVFLKFASLSIPHERLCSIESCFLAAAYTYGYHKHTKTTKNLSQLSTDQRAQRVQCMQRRTAVEILLFSLPRSQTRSIWCRWGWRHQTLSIISEFFFPEAGRYMKLWAEFTICSQLHGSLFQFMKISRLWNKHKTTQMVEINSF